MNQLANGKSENKKSRKEQKKNKKIAFEQGSQSKDTNKSSNPAQGNKNNRSNWNDMYFKNSHWNSFNIRYKY